MNPPSASYIFGYHGCDQAVADRALSCKVPLAQSHNDNDNDNDWLDDGVYFWEHSGQRAFDFAVEVARRPRHAGQRIRNPAVVGAIIDLGFCLDLLDARFTPMVQQAYSDLVDRSRNAGVTLLQNSGGSDLQP